MAIGLAIYSLRGEGGEGRGEQRHARWLVADVES